MAKATKPAVNEAPAPLPKYRQVVNILNSTRQQINDLLTEPDEQTHRLRLDTALNNHTQQLALLTGTDGGEITPAPNLGPATTAGGIPIGRVPLVRKDEVDPKKEQMKVFAGKVESLYDQFLNIDSKELLLKYEDLVLRGVAKKAHLKVTKDDPETLTIEFIEEIKASITEINALDEKFTDNLGNKEVDLDNMGETGDDEN